MVLVGRGRGIVRYDILKMSTLPLLKNGVSVFVILKAQVL